MQIIRNPADTMTIADPELRALIEKSIATLTPYDPDELGYFLIVQPLDTLDAINAQVGFNILANRWTGIRFDQPGYTPSFEVLEDLGGYLEMVFIISDSGFGIEVFIPKVTGIPPELLAMCKPVTI